MHIVNRSKPVASWLFAVSGAIAFIVVFGGWVRLSGSGLSMVDWHVVTGVVPPLSDGAWDLAFRAYRQTPEYLKVNAEITLDGYKSIYYVEYTHRMLGRLIGLAFVGPLVVFLVRGTIPWRRVSPYFGIGMLLALQGLVGWLMVQSGLVDVPRVSHYRLTLHLLLAVALLGWCLWLAFEHSLDASSEAAAALPTLTRVLSVLLLVSVCVQLAAGGLVAGMRAGYISDTFPKMFGQWLPHGLLALEPWIANLGENHVTVHFQHRWFAFVVLGLAVGLRAQCRSDPASRRLLSASSVLVLLLTLQIVAGVAVIIFGVPSWLASAHQAIGLSLFALSLFACHRAFRPVLSDADGLA